MDKFIAFTEKYIQRPLMALIALWLVVQIVITIVY